MEKYLTINNLHVRYQRDGSNAIDVVRDFSLSVAREEFLCVIGPSGCGKTTLLHSIAGLVKTEEGTIEFESKSNQRQNIGLLFQSSNLMRWRSVKKNIMLPLEIMGGLTTIEMEAKADALITLTGLEGAEEMWPSELSGGMAQRVSLARALIHNPDLLLLDEPFGALDSLTREVMGMELLRIWQKKKTTVIMVTHSISEALLLADRIVVLSKKPAKLCFDQLVPFTRPRAFELRYREDFGRLSSEIRRAIEM